MRTKRKNRLLSLGLCLCMLLGTIPMSGMTYAAGAPCPNHPAHTPECGYTQAVEGAPCQHMEAGEHDENCGYSEGTPEVPCDLGCTELDEDGQTVHAEGCAYAPAVPGTPCKHEQGQHDESCGYVEAVEGQPCAHACELCAPADSGPALACTCDAPCTGDAMNADCPVCGAEGALPEGCGFTACAKAEGCTLPDGHEGDCVPATALGAPAPASSDLIIGNGYTFEPGTGKLTVTSNAGTTNWRTDTNIAADDMARYQAVKLVEIKSGVTEIGDMAFAASSLTSITLPEGITAIGEYAFYLCPDLTSIVLPQSLTSIAGGAFPESYALSEINVADGNQHFASEGGVLYNKDKTTLLQYPASKTATSFTVPNSVTAIGDYAFYYCASLTSVALPASLTNIGKNAFDGCTALASVKLPTGLTTLEYRAFAACASLTSVDFPASLETIGDSAFLHSTSLAELTFRSDAPPNIDESAFSDIAASGTINFPSGKSADYTEDWRNGITGLSGWTLAEQGAPITGNGYTFEPGAGKLTVTSNAGTTNWCTDVSIAADDTARHEAVKSVEIKSGVTEIENWAFSECTGLTSVKLPTGLTTIGEGALWGCKSLIEINVADGNQSFASEGGVLYNKDKTTLLQYPIGKTDSSFTVPNSVTVIGDYAFDRCKNLTSVNLPTGLTTIGEGAFYDCAGLTSVDLPTGLTSIGASTFYGCTGLTSIDLPTGLTTIGDGAFYDCAGLTSVNFPASLTTIEATAFYGCTSLTSVNLPASLTTIGGYAFQECTSLAELTFRSDAPPNIGTNAFYLVANSGTINFPSGKSAAYTEGWKNGITGLSGWTLAEQGAPITGNGYTFEPGTGKLTVTSNAGTTNWQTDTNIAADDTARYEAVESVEIKSGVTGIGDFAFSRCTGLTSVDLPTGLTSIGTSTFYGCTGLTSIDLSALTNLTSIGDSTFFNCTGLTSIDKLPTGLTTIGKYTFEGCTSLTSIDLSTLTKLTSIGNSTFNGCTGLTSIDLPAGLTSIGSYTFSGCTSLTSIDLSALTNLTSIGDSTFSACMNLTSIDKLPAGLTSIGDSTFFNCTGLTSIGKLPTGLTSIGNYTFNGCAGLTSIDKLPTGLTSIGDNTFGRCTGLKRIDLSALTKLTKIGNSTFYGCTGLTSIDLPTGLTTIGSSAFYGCTGLTSVDLPAGLTTIGNSAFYGCTGLTSVDLPTGLTTIGMYAFNDCTSLTSADFPSGLTTIADSAFRNCTSLAELTFRSDAPPNIKGSAFYSVANSGTIKYPYGKSAAYTEDWKNNTLKLTSWTLEEMPAPTYRLTVVNGTDTTGKGLYGKGDQVSIQANPNSSGKEFERWVTSGGGAFADANSASTTFTMPAGNVTVTATYKDVSTYPLSVQARSGGTITGTASGSYAAGTAITLKAIPNSNYRFDGWEATGVTLTGEQKGNAELSFAMPAGGVTLAAGFTSTGSGGGSGGGSDHSDRTSVIVEPSKPTEQDPNPPTESTITPPAAVDKDGNVKVDVSDKDIQTAIDKAVAQAKKDGTQANGIALSIDLSGLRTTFYKLPLTLSEAAYGMLVEAGVRYISILTPQISLKLDLATLKTIHAAVEGSVTIDAAQIDRTKLPQAAQTALGTRPAYDLSITSGGKTISSFGGSVALALPYTLHDRERGGELQMVWLDGENRVQYITGSSYSENQGAMLAQTDHFTVFGVAEKPAPAFADIESHWAKDDILFAASRGLLNGTADQVFSPDGSMTRGMFVTALGRLAGVDPENYRTGRFTDVSAGSYCAPYVNWAADKGVVNGATASTFAPDRAISRQELAAILVNYAKALGYEMPVTRQAVTFTDSASIADWAKDAVRAMQQAGVVMGKEGNRFDPTATATRAEVSAVLRRFVERIIDPATAQGWDRNDSGKWVFYVDGVAVTGERVIGGTTYHFDGKGQLTKIDAIAPDTKKTITYTVRKDDTLWSIAERHNCTVAEIVALNKALIEDPNKILAGWELKVPQK